uniref:Uncharacterized protein n=1 Tax=Schistosoma japonicum TaxID=6182 RepID=C7TS15_SCHJA|nr:hypothetical protein [Schistosoma japonicum]CAX80394.1 hypothetical protein [Schistosoma japonicum]CAX80395.1 hypothetical protein [Schistosoma japonicum]CAX80396.1 hypothetical protein [Schistosoma japonicum]CAX80397.1 hypothetical protein [Schistosoma japonicum]
MMKLCLFILFSVFLFGNSLSRTISSDQNQQDTTDPMVTDAGDLITDDVDDVNETATTEPSNVDMRNKSNPELLHGYYGYRWRCRRCRHHRCCRHRHHHHCRHHRYRYRYYYYW